MRTVHILILFTGILFLSSCVSVKQFADVQDKLKEATSENERLKQTNMRLETTNTELKSENRQLKEKNEDLNSRLEEALYESNVQKQKNAGLKVDIQNLNRQLDILKTGSSSEIEQLLEELQTARRDLNARGDRLLEAEKELEDRNARLIELQNVLAQKDQAVKELKEKVMNALTGFTNKGLTVHEKNGKVYVSMDEKLLFKTGQWSVDPNGQRALRDLSQLLAENTDINIMVEGHTDNVPMRGSGEVKDNWDLSVMRATAVTKILTQNVQLDPERIIAAGRSEYVPLTVNETAEGRQMNRRTEIILTPKLDELLEILEAN
ncbi:cell envelope biogenesis protein OmpA [Mariniphaga sediminis]|uniref:Cell envelope biogenesis protein OmpA n=1 Tax=Mariniphaga sediminis TaxID=1628158 RepID=A0A399CVI3_9BACT|nr:OmpA family protein [Mariniphaga sediminis]RIH63785.1 cell envelope biogenesis protein OmpA [Mariniphaga sediminis]